MVRPWESIAETQPQLNPALLRLKESIRAAWEVIVSLLKSGAIKPIVAKTFRLVEAATALRYLVEGRPFGRVVLTI